MNKAQNPKKVVVVGGGFGGITAIQKLRKTGVGCDITLVTKGDVFEYYPALYKLVTGALAIEVSVPYRKIKGLKKVHIEKGVFVSVDPARQVIILEGGRELPYDYLVLALGSETNYFNISGLSDLSLSFKSVKEAFRLKRHFCELFGTAISLSPKDAVSKLHTVIVGGGPSGVELAGDLTHYLRGLAESFNVDPSLVTIDLIEASSRILPTLSEKVSQRADRRLRTLGVNIYTNRSVMGQDINEVTMAGMNFQSNTVIWTAGTRINSAYKSIPGVEFDERNRVIVNETFALSKDNHIFVIGDGAATKYSGLAQTAIHNGKYLGKHLGRIIEGKSNEPYVPSPVSLVIPIGNYWALFIHGRHLFRGLAPWLLRSVVDFKYFFSIVPFWYVLKIIRQGAKYRRSRTYCPTE